MNKFYNPKMYKAPPKRELSEEERITLNMGGTLAPTAPPGGIAGTGISALQTADGVVEVSFSAAYRKQAEASNGVIAMMDMMIQDVKKDVQEAKIEEAERPGGVRDDDGHGEGEARERLESDHREEGGCRGVRGKDPGADGRPEGRVRQGPGAPGGEDEPPQGL